MQMPTICHCMNPPPWKFSAYATEVYSKVWIKSNVLKYPSVCLEISFFSILLRRQLSPVPTPSPTKAISPTAIKRPLNNGHRDDIRPKTSKHYWSGSSRFTLSSTRGCTGSGFQDSSPTGFSTFWTNRIGSGLRFYSCFRIRIGIFKFLFLVFAGKTNIKCIFVKI